VCQYFYGAGGAIGWVPSGLVSLYPDRSFGAVVGQDDRTPQVTPTGAQGPLSSHIRDLYDRACQGCASDSERLAMALILREYKDVSSRGDHDMGLTKVVHHDILLAAGTLLMRQEHDNERQFYRSRTGVHGSQSVYPAANCLASA